jgi:hypothetical protein
MAGGFVIHLQKCAETVPFAPNSYTLKGLFQLRCQVVPRGSVVCNKLRGQGRASKHPPELRGQVNPPLMLPHRLVEKYNDQTRLDRWGGFPKVEGGNEPSPRCGAVQAQGCLQACYFGFPSVAHDLLKATAVARGQCMPAYKLYNHRGTMPWSAQLEIVATSLLAPAS